MRHRSVIGFPRLALSRRTLGRRALLAASTATLVLASSTGWAQQTGFPTKPVTLVVPYAAGGPTDVAARLLAGPMARSLGQPVVVENTVGAGGTLAGTEVSRAKPDGYTILLQHMGMATAPALYRQLAFDPLKDFAYVGQVMDVPMTLLTRKDFPANSLPELLAYLRSHQDSVSIAHAGKGAVSQLCALLFMHQTGVNLPQVVYRGAGPALEDLMGGHVDLLCDQTTQTAPVIREGKRVKVFGVTTPARLATLPKVPTLAEQGLTGVDVKVWHGIYAPKATPLEVVAKLNTALKAALQDAAVKKRLTELNAEIVPLDKATPEGLRDHLRAETERWGTVLRKAGAAVH